MKIASVMIIIPMLVCICTFHGCSKPASREANVESDYSEAAQKTDVIKRQELEKKLKGLGFELYPGVRFREMTGMSGNYTIRYDIESSDMQNMQVGDFYKRFTERLATYGWTLKKSKGTYNYRINRGRENITITVKYDDSLKINSFYVGYHYR